MTFAIFFNGYYVGMFTCSTNTEKVKERKRLQGLFPQFKVELIKQ